VFVFLRQKQELQIPAGLRYAPSLSCFLGKHMPAPCCVRPPAKPTARAVAAGRPPASGYLPAPPLLHSQAGSRIPTAQALRQAQHKQRGLPPLQPRMLIPVDKTAPGQRTLRSFIHRDRALPCITSWKES